jgi:phage repressor protein C with HTH and peptisase S24 domain
MVLNWIHIIETGIDAESIAAGGVFVLTIAGMIMIKHLQIMLNGDLKISSDNKAYDPETIPADERDEKVIIHGWVFWSGGPLGGRG